MALVSEALVVTTAIGKRNKPHDLPMVKQAPVNWVGGLMVIPHRKEVLEIMKFIPYGEMLTLDEIRVTLAKEYNVDIACSMTTGIFIYLAAQAYEEGNDPVSYWRISKEDGELNAQFPGGIEAHKKKLESEGHTVY